jgi:hypothetical protein
LPRVVTSKIRVGHMPVDRADKKAKIQHRQ